MIKKTPEIPPEFAMNKTMIQGHSYSAEIIFLMLSLVLNASVSLRGSEKVLTLFNQAVGNPLQRVPSWFSVRHWLLRLGHYKLHRKKQKAGDWCWILDHTIQLGKTKCLLILGLRLSEYPDKGRQLHYDELEPIELIPVEASNGEIVYQQLEQAAQKTGVPRVIVSDYGSDLKSGIEHYCDSNPHCQSIYDIKHKTACLLKAEMEKNEDWLAFRKQATQTKSQLQQTVLSHLKAPNQRSKSRYMNMGILVKWGLETQQIITNTCDYTEPEKQQVHKLEWLMEYQDKLKQWNELLQVAILTETWVRKKGISQNGHITLEQQINKHSSTDPHDRAVILKNTLIEFVKVQGEKCQEGEILLGSSEIIESVFGKQKYLERDYAKEGFTSLILATGAIVGKMTVETIKDALTSTPVKTIKQWCKNQLGETLHSKKMKAYSDGKRGTKAGSTL